MKYETFQALFKHAPMINHPTASTQQLISAKKFISEELLPALRLLQTLLLYYILHIFQSPN